MTEPPRITEEDWRIWETDWFSAEQSEWEPVTQMCKTLGGLEHLAGIHISQRKWRLFMVACLHRVRHIFQDERTRSLIDALEEIAEGEMTDEEYWQLELRSINPPNPDCVEGSDTCPPERRPVGCACEALGFAANSRLDSSGVHTGAAWARNALGDEAAETLFQVKALRDIFGDPFRPATVDPMWLSWNDGTVVKLASTIYDRREFDMLPILGDALEEAGCRNEEIIKHCRVPEIHVRGCWLLDSLLGKE
ncbi:MAG: hypothetical protein ACFCD0_29585 [Gemmataceae bacterium]